VRFVRSIPMPEGYTFAVGSSGVVAEKTGAAMEKYNTASGLAGALAELWRQATGRDDPHLAAIVASGPGAVERLEETVRTTRHERYGTEALLARLEHFVTENEELRPAAGDALARGDMTAFGRFVDCSQKLSETRLGNQVPETIYLAAAAREHGAVAASAFGAGFGGSVWAMVANPRLEAFLADWAAAYRARFPQRAEASQFFPTGAGPASFQLG
jgi:galactokinase